MRISRRLLGVFCFSAFWILASGCASTGSARLLKDYPELRPADGSESPFTWTKFDGFDFLVFYADLPANPSAGAGIYQGGNPTFKPPRDLKPVAGKLGVFEVDWYELPDKDAKYYRTCLIDYQKTAVQRGQQTVVYTTRRHVWAYADTLDNLETVIAGLGQMKMFAVRPPDLTE
jgi:hypothetical protein